jgi:hypothetical protein
VRPCLLSQGIPSSGVSPSAIVPALRDNEDDTAAAVPWKLGNRMPQAPPGVRKGQSKAKHSGGGMARPRKAKQQSLLCIRAGAHMAWRMSHTVCGASMIWTTCWPVLASMILQ